MIKEDYCSYEVAKLLKEKGFDWECIGYYVDDEPDDVKYSFLYETNSTWEPRCCSAPTHQMAMKWFREIHKVVISIDAHTANHWDGYIDTFEIDILKNASRIIVPDKIAIHNTYEEAVEAALKYCLNKI